jgi:putative PIN family toxin of toxin-antitoxin system
VLVVVDTNLIVSGVFWGGNPYKLLEHWVAESFQVAVTGPVLDEYVRVLRDLSDTQPDLARDWIDFITTSAHFVEPTLSVKLCRDPADDKFLACALSAGADFLVSGDADLLTMRDIHGIPIVTVRDFLEKLPE